MSKKKHISQRGVSLLELIIVLVLIGVVSTIALTQFGRTQSRFQRQNMARELKVYLERARYDSIKRRASVPVNTTQPDNRAYVVIRNATSFEVATDSNISGTIDNTDTRLFSFSGRSNVKFVDTLVFPITIRFDQRGLAEIRNGNNVRMTNPVFTLCEGNCTQATANAGNSSIISITPTGTIIMMDGGQTVTNINSPNVTNVITNTNIRCDARASSNVNCT
jgi:prepilin-type N-terminal cleavage/methylation domain-containing protein